ncbi:hypothetical protein JQ615_11160 [Bradyrhizobium jicamae]|uniref:Methyltransferase FkbM domain-containing protein n=1 Tax=Bradyrhizobium jicamae TaxID=280332 RepID=A0ABS5FGN7_9BRAD|nr:hypothetical protein [Bradyrhizobium jicamae]MBR0795950.1 hypothetical protein [Bradyrhizobium jicamae]
MTSADTAQADGLQTNLDHFLASNGIKLNAAQRRRVGWLVHRLGNAVLSQGGSVPVRDSGVIVVVEPPSGPAAETLYRTLRTGCAVVIPFGENPAFDFLKSKLTDFGTIGPGTDGPHEMWWGGVNWRALGTGKAFRTDAPLRVISCYPRGRGDEQAQRLRDQLAEYRIACDIAAVDTADDGCVHASEKAAFVRQMWQQHREPLLFIEADAVLTEAPMLPSNLDCDLALHKWNRWEMSARTLYVGRSAAAEALLHNWHHIATAYPSVWEGYLLDQAWCLTSSQMPLDTVWLPRSYHAPTEDTGTPRHTTIVHDLPADNADLGPDAEFGIAMRTARRAGRSGGRDSMIVVKSQAMTSDAITVIMRDIASSDAREIAASIEAVTGAFAADCGGFGRLELSLCPWQDDIRAAKSAAKSANNRIIEIAPWQTLPADLFRTIGQSRDAGSVVVMAGHRG